ncbi:hypothetical protein IWQ60_009107 [Tieghemiomyces parasiticus]|uniref:MTOR-associated protein MEAK7 n=1 Tax=Tieghemiomyces parasiticus TaxID=78921 RepID=A0A9W7ZV03_9FUNG|nr:hypothetical protein IWQ60_009107 [Tieghemiomyces parasiticus]
MTFPPHILARQRQVAQIAARIFNKPFSAEGKRTGAQILRQPLKGPEVNTYYPAPPIKISELRKLLPEFELIDSVNGPRLAKLDSLRRRGKGAPVKVITHLPLDRNRHLAQTHPTCIMGNSSSHSPAEVEASVYLNSQERESLQKNYDYICRMLNVEPKDGIPVQKLRASKILPSFLVRGLLAPPRDPQDLSKPAEARKPLQVIKHAEFLLAACRVARSAGAEQVAIFFDMADLTGRTLYDWVAHIVALALEAWHRTPRRAGRIRSPSSTEVARREDALVRYLLLAPYYKREQALDFDFDPASERHRTYRFNLAEWLKRCETPGNVDLPAFRYWLNHNPALRHMTELAFERIFFTPLDPTRPLLPYPEAIAAQRLMANLLSPRQVGRSQLLTRGDQWFLNDALPSTCREEWDLVFASDLDGKSWNTFVHRLSRSGATLIVIREQGTGYIFGGFASDDWVSHPDFYGTSANFLFTVRPDLRVYPAGTINAHYQYLNQGTQTLPNGLGMGGQLGYFGLWINADFETGCSQAGPACSTYGSPRLSHEEYFRIESIEVWQVRRSPTDSDDEDGAVAGRPQKSAMDAHPDAVALLELANRKMYASSVRDPDLDLDPPTASHEHDHHPHRHHSHRPHHRSEVVDDEDDMEAILKRRPKDYPEERYK